LRKEEGSEGSGLAEKMELGREKSARGRRWPLNKGRRENKGARGPVGAQPHGGGGGLAMARARAGGPRAQAGAIVQRQPEDGGAGSCTGEAGVEREGESRGEGWPVGRLTEWGPAIRGRGENGKWVRLQFK
jgi:hypothetical protein